MQHTDDTWGNQIFLGKENGAHIDDMRSEWSDGQGRKDETHR